MKSLISAALALLALTSACTDAAEDGPRVLISGGVKSADQPVGEGTEGLGVQAGALASSGLAIVALDTRGNTVSAPLSAAGAFQLAVAPNTSYTLNLLDTVRNVYIASFLYRSGSTVELALSVTDQDVELGSCQVMNGEIWCDQGFFDPDEDEVVEVPSDMYGRLRTVVRPSEATRDLVASLLGGLALEYDLAPNPLNRFHVALTRHDGDTCTTPLVGVAEKVGNERYLYTDRVYTNDTCRATVRFQVMCTMTQAARCEGFLRFDIVSSGSDCSAYPPMHVAEPVTVDVLERGQITCPLPATCTGHSDCESGVCNSDVGFCAAVPETQALRFHVFDVGNGQSVLAITPSGKSILIDAGRPQTGRMLAAMIRRIVPRLDMLILSHYDADHAGGAVPMMLGPDGYPGRRGVDDDKKNGVDDEGEIGAPGSDDIMPAEVLDRGLSPMPVGFDDYVRILGSRRRQPVAGEVYDFGDGATMTILTVNGRVAGGQGLPVEEENARSVGVIFRYGDFSLTNLGDLPAGGLGTDKMEQLIIPAIIDDLPIDVHFLSHHGSKASSPPELLKALRPRVSIISVGDSDRCGAGFNSYGLPAQEVLDAVNATGTIQKIYQTGEGGASFTGNCVPEPKQVYPRDYGATDVVFSYSVFSIEASEERFRVSGLTFDDSYDAAGCVGAACSSCPPGYLENPATPGRCMIDPCVPDPCHGNGLCAFAGVDAFTCTCSGNFGGATCADCKPGYDGTTCEACASGFVADPSAPTRCVDDPCDPEACNTHGTCTVAAGGAATCACAGHFAGASCERCETGYEGTDCAVCASGFVTDPTAPGTCIADPCLVNPCGAHGACSVTGPAAFTCGCEPRWAGPTCGVCATGYSGADCASCAAGYVKDPQDPSACIVDLCTAGACGGRGTCTMRGAGAFECACTGHFAGPTCGTCAEGYAGANCESCAAGAHLEAGVCALNRSINGCQVQGAAFWGSAGEAMTVAATVSTGDMTASGRQPGVDARVCWREAAIAWPIVYGDLTCVSASYTNDTAIGERYAAPLTFPKAGLFKLIASFSGNGGTTWTACDPDGVATSAMKPATATIYNVNNGGFEAMDSPLDRWVADLGLDVEAETDRVHSGLRSVRLTRVSTVNADTDFTADAIAVTAGKSYTVSMWFWDTDPNARANVVYAFYDAADAPVGATSFGGVYTADQATWQNITRVVVAPTGATRVRISTRIYQQSGGTATGGAVILDDVALIPAP